MASGKSRQTILPGADVKPAETRTVNWVEYITDTLRQHEQIEQRVIIQLQEYAGAQQVRVSGSSRSICTSVSCLKTP